MPTFVDEKVDIAWGRASRADDGVVRCGCARLGVGFAGYGAGEGKGAEDGMDEEEEFWLAGGGELVVCRLGT